MLASTEARLRDHFQFAWHRRNVLGQSTQLGGGVLLGNATHDAVGATDHVVAFHSVGLERHVEVVGMLASDLGVAGIDGFAEIGTMTGGASTLLKQRRHLGGCCLGGFGGRHTRVVGRIVGSQVGNVLLGERTGNAAHAGMLAVTLLVGHQGGRNVLVGLARNFGHPVNFGEAVLVARDAMAANAHRGLGFSGLHIACSLHGCSEEHGDSRACDNGFHQAGQEVVHFASTIRRTFDKNQCRII